MPVIWHERWWWLIYQFPVSPSTRHSSAQFTCTLLGLRLKTVSDSQHTFMEIYFGPAVIGSSEPDPEALRLGLRSECSSTTKRQSGESVIKSLVDLKRGSNLNAHVRRYGQGVSDLLIGRGKEGVYISSPEPLPPIRLLDIPSVLGPVKNWDYFTAPVHRQTLYFLAAS